MLKLTCLLSFLVLLESPFISCQSAPAVAIVSGYAGVSRFGRNLDAMPTRGFAGNNVRNKVDSNERAPFFDLGRMEEEEMLQRKIEEVRRQVMEEEKRQKEALRMMRINHPLKMDSEQQKQEEIPWSDTMRMSEPRVQRMMQLRHIRHHGKLQTLDNNELKEKLDDEDVRQPPDTIDLGSVQEVRVL